MSFKLVVLDLDGTVLDPFSDAPISPAVVAAIHRVRSRGVGVTLATGRTLEYVRSRAAVLELDLPVITSQGAVLGHPGSGEVIHEFVLDPASTERVAAYAAQSQRVVCTYLRAPDGTLAIMQNREVRSSETYDHWFGAGRLLTAWPPGCEVLKFIVVSAPDEPDATAELRERFEPAVHIVRTHPFLVEGTAAGVDKGSGLRRLLEHLRIAPERVLAIGDHDNDLPMFAVAGTAVAMGQAGENVRRAAHWVAPSVDDDGVATALGHFIP